MKKWNLLLGAAMLALTLSACGSSSGDDVKRIDKSAETAASSGTDQNAVNSANGQAATADGYVFETQVSGKTVAISVDSPMADILAALGDPASYFEAASCAFEGLDKMYTYGHFRIDTYPSTAGDKISAIYLTDDLVSTKEGLTIGASKADMEKLYGTGYEANGTEYIYKKGSMSLKIILDADKVSSITYASQVLGTVAGN